MTALPRLEAVQGERLTPLVSFGGVAIAASCALGGGTRGGFLSDALLELATLPIFLTTLGRLSREAPLPTALRAALVFCAALAAVPLLQLVPLPPGLWTALPGRGTIADAYRLVSPDLPWAAVSLAPIDTAQAVLSLIPAFTVFCATVAANSRERRQFSLIFVAMSLVGAFLGLAQIAQGSSSPLRPFAITSNDVAVGLFANRNHFALALCAAIALAAAWVAAGLAAVLKPRRSRTDSGPYAIILLAGIVIAVLAVGVLTTRSRAGFVLMLLALLSGMALAPWRYMEWRRRLSARTIGAAAVLGVIGIGVFAQLSLLQTLERFAENTVPGDRLLFARNTLAVAWSLLPVGSGVGSFVPVYAMHETAADMQVRAFVNHAHDDLIETVLETGVIGPLLLAVFGVWFVRAALRIWRKPYFQGHDVDRALGRAATVILGLVALHSLVDYPLRTGAIMAVVAFACGLMFEPLYAPAETAIVPLERGPRSGQRQRRSSRGNGPRPLDLRSPR